MVKVSNLLSSKMNESIKMLKSLKLFFLLIVSISLVSCAENKKSENSENDKNIKYGFVTEGKSIAKNKVADYNFLNQEAPNFQWQDENGKFKSIKDLKGKIVILDFWATWCPPCRAEIPHFVELSKEFADKDFVMLGVSVDQGKEVVEKFVKSYKMNYLQVVVKPDVIAAYGVKPIPTTFVLNKEGKIVNRFVGYRDKDVFENELKKHL